MATRLRFIKSCNVWSHLVNSEVSKGGIGMWQWPVIELPHTLLEES
jgi:hypothetical protein